MENHITKTDSGYVLKNSKGQYFIGYNQISDQLRKAKIYHSERYADQCIKELANNPKRLLGVVCDFKKIKIKIKEIEDYTEVE